MTRHRAETYTESIERFLEAADWLTDADTPAVTTLTLLARKLDDDGFHAQTIAQFGLCYRALLKRAPGGDDDETDPLDALLEKGGKNRTANPAKGNDETENEKNNPATPAAAPCGVLCQRTCPDADCPGLSS